MSHGLSGPAKFREMSDILLLYRWLSLLKIPGAYWLKLVDVSLLHYYRRRLVKHDFLGVTIYNTAATPIST